LASSDGRDVAQAPPVVGAVGAAAGCLTASISPVGRVALGGGGVDVRGGAKSVSSFAQAGQTWVPMRLHVSHCPQTIPISRTSFGNVSSRS
jgi:hypothetical protein